MRQFFLIIASVLFPWFILLMYGNIIGALIAVVLQVTIIGWPFAIAWSFRTIKKNRHTPKKS